jgi:hypothetical protein
MLLVPILILQAYAQRVYVEGSAGYKYVAGVDRALPREDSAGHDETMELAKTFLQRCPDLVPTIDREKADFDVRLNWSSHTRLFFGGKLIHKPDQILVTSRDGDVIYSGIARSVGGDVDGACTAIRNTYRSAQSKEQPRDTSAITPSVPRPVASESVKPDASIGAASEGNPTVRHDGVTLTAIEAGGPCDQAGLQAGDVLMSLDGHFLYTVNEVTEEVHRHKPGERIPISFRRRSITYETYVALGPKATAPASDATNQF